jgi:hypothetical protein
VDRARRIANSLLALMPESDRGRHLALAHQLGETWLGERLLMHTPDEAITTDEAAALVSVSREVIRRWACTRSSEEPGRMLLPRAGRRGRSMTYLTRNVLEASAEASRTRRTGSVS